MKWCFLAWTRILDFEGRSRRMEYWMFMLVQTTIVCVARIFLPLIISSHIERSNKSLTGLMILAVILYCAGSFAAHLSLTIRRFHDIGKSGWWYLLNAIPFGPLFVLIMMAQEGQVGTNMYGPDPKADRY